MDSIDKDALQKAVKLIKGKRAIQIAVDSSDFGTRLYVLYSSGEIWIKENETPDFADKWVKVDQSEVLGG